MIRKAGYKHECLCLLSESARHCCISLLFLLKAVQLGVDICARFRLKEQGRGVEGAVSEAP